MCEIISTSTRIYQTVFLPLGSIHIKRKRAGETEFVQSGVFIGSRLSNGMLTGLGSNVFSAPRELYFLLCHEPNPLPLNVSVLKYFYAASVAPVFDLNRFICNNNYIWGNYYGTSHVLSRAVFPSENQPDRLHYRMFIPTLEGQASVDQLWKWLQMSMSYEILGTYAQTELGHGSYMNCVFSQKRMG